MAPRSSFDDTENDGNSRTITGIVVGAIALVGIISFIVWLVQRRKTGKSVDLTLRKLFMIFDVDHRVFTAPKVSLPRRPNPLALSLAMRKAAEDKSAEQPPLRPTSPHALAPQRTATSGTDETLPPAYEPGTSAQTIPTTTQIAGPGSSAPVLALQERMEKIQSLVVELDGLSARAPSGGYAPLSSESIRIAQIRDEISRLSENRVDGQGQSNPAPVNQERRSSREQAREKLQEQAVEIPGLLADIMKG